MVEVIVEPLAQSGGHRLTVDGVDLSNVVTAGGLSIQFDEMGHAQVTLTLQPAHVRLRLPEAEVRAVEAYLAQPTDTDAYAYAEALMRSRDAPRAQGL